MNFDGTVCKYGVRASVFVVNLAKNKAEGHGYQLNFQCTNNITEYEALILGLQILKKLGEK